MRINVLATVVLLVDLQLSSIQKLVSARALVILLEYAFSLNIGMLTFVDVFARKPISVLIQLNKCGIQRLANVNVEMFSVASSLHGHGMIQLANVTVLSR